MAALSKQPNYDMRYARFATFGVFLLLSPGGLSAQTVSSPFDFIESVHSVGLFAGYIQASTGDLDIGPTSAPIFGAQYDLHFTGPLSGEIRLGFTPSTRTIYTNPEGGDDSLVPLAETDLNLLVGEAGIHFRFTGARTWHGLAPYAAATGGFVADLTRTDPLELEEVPEIQRFDFGTAFAAAFGLGTDFFLTERLSLRADARDHLWRLAYPIGLTGTGERETEWTHNIALTLGGTIHF